ncbi:unnamed protein product, partial [Dibothriocephalus latus]
PPQWAGADVYHEGGPAPAHHFPPHHEQQQPPPPSQRPYFQHPDQYGGPRPPRFPGSRLSPSEVPPFDDYHPPPPHHQPPLPPPRRPHPVYEPRPNERFPAPYDEDYRPRPPAGGLVSRDYVIYDPHGNYDDSLSYTAPDYEQPDEYHQNHHAGAEPREPTGADFRGPEGQPYEVAEYPAVGPPAPLFPPTAHPNSVLEPTFYHPPRGSPAMKPFVASGLSIPDHLIPAFSKFKPLSHPPASHPVASVSLASSFSVLGTFQHQESVPS